MKTDPEALRILQGVLTNELTSVNQYVAHAELCAHWGFTALAQKIAAEVEDERKHVTMVVSRILFLEGVPDLASYHALTIGNTAPEALANDLQMERAAIKFLNESLPILRKLGDHGTEELLRSILVSEEEHADWLEIQLRLLDALGPAGYLAQKL